MLKIFNSLSKQTEEFVPSKPGEVGMYACGPTVYDFPHIGHGRKYVNDDILKRVLENTENLNVTHVQNITDVGHLVSDGDEGEDKLEKGAMKYGKTVWQVAEEYTDYFLKEMDSLNIIRPTIQCKATEHVEDQIELIKKIIANGYAYDTPEAVYFDVSRFPDYGKLFGQSIDEKLVGVREEVVTDNSKKSPADFALWFKTVGKHKDHVMHWNSPWGDGFPGWHIECSAMSMKYLGEQIDLHTGGEDHVSIHHPNEIAQSEAGTGKKPFVKYWFHSSFLMVDGKKMSKSLGNVYRVSDIVEKGYSAMALRYLYLTAHYRKQMNFTWEAIEGAEKAYMKLVNFMSRTLELKESRAQDVEVFISKFAEAVEDDLNMPKALAVVWEMMKGDLADEEKKYLLLEFDKVMGLNLGTQELKESRTQDNEDINKMVEERERFRAEKNWAEADRLRDQLIAMGVTVKDK